VKSEAKLVSMRDALGQTLLELAPEMPELVVLDADVSASTKTAGFAKAYPDRFFNVGVAEANMADIALEVDGREVNLNPFVRTFIERTVLGMITSLSGVGPEPKKITLSIDRGAAAGPRRMP